MVGDVNLQQLAFTNRLIASLSAFEDHAIGLLPVRRLIKRQSRGFIHAMPTQRFDRLTTNFIASAQIHTLTRKLWESGRL